jgi:hypothetical protein
MRRPKQASVPLVSGYRSTRVLSQVGALQCEVKEN